MCIRDRSSVSCTNTNSSHDLLGWDRRHPQASSTNTTRWPHSQAISGPPTPTSRATPRSRQLHGRAVRKGLHQPAQVGKQSLASATTFRVCSQPTNATPRRRSKAPGPDPARPLTYWRHSPRAARADLGLERGVLRLQHFLLRPEVVDPLLQGVEGVLELLLLLGELLVLGLHGVDLGLGRGLAGESLLRQILLTLGERSLGLVLEVVHRVLELLLLQFDLLARRCDVHQRPADLGDLLEHLLVGEIKHLVGLLGGVERLVGLGMDYVVGPLEEGHVDLLLVDDERSPRRFCSWASSGWMPALVPTWTFPKATARCGRATRRRRTATP